MKNKKKRYYYFITVVCFLWCCCFLCCWVMWFMFVDVFKKFNRSTHLHTRTWYIKELSTHQEARKQTMRRTMTLRITYILYYDLRYKKYERFSSSSIVIMGSTRNTQHASLSKQQQRNKKKRRVLNNKMEPKHK